MKGSEIFIFMQVVISEYRRAAVGVGMMGIGVYILQSISLCRRLCILQQIKRV